MATITCGSLSYTVDHAVKGADYVHGYDANGRLVVSIDGVSSFSGITYSGTYLSPDKCLEEACNIAKYVNGSLVKNDGTPIDIKSGTEITAGTADLEAGVSKLATGTLYLVYE